jgi:2-polyprenyl-3-methyl-5-hydroxy-6-metoxy-1,4-benzoquinol methylase
MNPADASRLSEHRMRAAVASQGTSNEAVYRAVLSVTGTAGLSGEVLDFGAGAGALMERLLASGFTGTLTGADMLPRPAGIRDDIQWIQADLNEPIPRADASFNAIVAAEVIEHLENPRAAFREFRRLLKPHGQLLLTTPNQESVRAFASLVLRGHFVDFLDGSYPCHITALVRKDFERIAAEAGFVRPRFVYTDDGGVPRYPAMTWQRVSLGLLRGRLFSDNVLVLTQRDADPC